MAVKKSVFLSDRTANFIKLTTCKEGFDIAPKWSESINATTDQFRYLLKINVPELSIYEWTSIFNVYNGCMNRAHSVPVRVASDMMDYRGAIDLEQVEKDDPDYAALVRKVYAMTQVEQIAITYVAQWATQWELREDDDWLTVVGMIVEKL
jgi:broad specificity polyphosphatase/5'/3'-nucleotidase SurE